MKKVLILGITGQDGSYCADILLSKNFKVYGMVRKSATGNTKNIDHLIINKKIINKKFFILHGDLLDTMSIIKIISENKFDYIYNFADQDHVKWSFEIPYYSLNVTSYSVYQILDIINKYSPKSVYFHPISSNIFNSENKFISENSSFNPVSPYALAKLHAYNTCLYFKKTYNLKICGAFFFNHESPRRADHYVTQKIIKAAVNIYKGLEKNIVLGDINAKIDWGYAKEYVQAAIKISMLKDHNFYVIGSGKTTSVKIFLEKSFKYLGLNYKNYLKIDKKLLRVKKTGELKADYSKAKKDFGFKPKTDIDLLIKIMIDEYMKKIS